jgi:cell division cycle 20-like protein 1, cofactor of APC complex
VKAIDWSPHQRGVLASGGGTADRCIKFWDTVQGAEIQSIDTEAQVSNIMFSKTSHELISTHGYSENAICVWKCPSMQQI